MIKFDGGEMTRLIKKKKLCTEITLTILALLLISAVISAVLTRNAIVQKSELGNEVSALWITAFWLVCFIAVIIFYAAPTNRQLKKSVCKEIADGMLKREDMLKGGGKIEFSADYSGNILTLSRKGFTGEISIDPSRLKTAEGLGGAGAKIEIDLQPLKASPSVYSTAGSRLWLFLQAYYYLNGEKNGAEQVTITDNMGKTPYTLQIFAGGSPAKNAEKNYFIKRGLIK